jgi:hypothetical protein
LSISQNPSSATHQKKKNSLPETTEKFPRPKTKQNQYPIPNTRKLTNKQTNKQTNKTQRTREIERSW